MNRLPTLAPILLVFSNLACGPGVVGDEPLADAGQASADGGAHGVDGGPTPDDGGPPPGDGGADSGPSRVDGGPADGGAVDGGAVDGDAGATDAGDHWDDDGGDADGGEPGDAGAADAGPPDSDDDGIPDDEDEFPDDAYVDCAVSDWSGFSDCSDLCGGARVRTRTVVTEPAFGGAPCPVLEESEPCSDPERTCSDMTMAQCAEHVGCVWDTTCLPYGGCGTRPDEASCVHSDACQWSTDVCVPRPPQGSACASYTEEATCNADPDCYWLFDECVEATPLTDSDGDGWYDEVDAFPSDPAEWSDTDLDGTGDNADLDDDDDGFSDACDEWPRDAAVDCVVSAWSEWSGCGGEVCSIDRVRTRTVVVDPAFGGAACPSLRERESCEPPAPAPSCEAMAMAECEAHAACEWTTSCLPRTTCSSRPDALTCEHSDACRWEVESGGGYCVDRPIPSCADLATRDACGATGACLWIMGRCYISGAVADADGDGWSDWSDAFPSDNSEQLDSDGDGVGNNADGDDDDDDLLDTCDDWPRDAVVHCQVSVWSPWSECSAACGGGTRSRQRTVTTPAAYGGDACPIVYDEETCNEQPC